MPRGALPDGHAPQGHVVSQDAIGPRTADAIRKVIGYALATVLTLLLFRLFGRLSNARQTMEDPELWTFLVLSTLAVIWVRAARRVRRAQAPVPPLEGEAPAMDDRDAFM